MTEFQKVIKYLAIAFAIFLAVSIIGGILSAVGFFGGFIDSNDVLADTKIYTVSDDITELDIKINAANFSIRHADKFSVESNLKHLTLEEKGGILTVKETKKYGRNYNGAVLTLYIPEGVVFEKADITTGAGVVSIDTLAADTLKLVLGAGDVNIGSLTANKSADIVGGAGRITVSGGSLRDLDFEMGVGQLNLTAEFLGECDFELGIGESNITLIGSESDYTIDAEKGLGNLTVNGKSEPSLKDSGSGKNHIDISGGIGAIHLTFKDE